MKVLSTLLAAVSLSGAAVRAHPFDLPFQISEADHEFLEHNIEQRSYSYVPIKGVPQTDIQPRYEIRTLVHEYTNQFDLFILAMQKFQAQPASKITGYYEVAGIHGVPRVDWNDVGQCANCQGTDGYCTHGSVLFPAWHRAYMALFEQELFNVVQNIAAQFEVNGVKGGPTRATMQKAAKKFRMPYWDWASIPPAGQHNLPGSISGNLITVNTPTGEQTLKNPLYRFVFNEQTENPNGGVSTNLGYSPFTSWDFTIRYPTNDSADAVSNEASCVAAFDQMQATLQDQIYQLMTTCTDYLHFSNINGGGSSSCSNSLENIHDIVHSTAGGPGTSEVPTGGDMTYLSLAAFDPVFWLHHANVDRMFALWQTLHTSYGATQTQVAATWTYPTGSVQGPNSPLKPFTKNKAGDFWTTNLVKDWANTFHYTYPEFLSGGSKQQIASAVNALYGPHATTPAANTKRTAMPEPIVDAESAASSGTSTATSAQSTGSSTGTSAQSTGSSTGTSTTVGTSAKSATASATTASASGITLPSPFVAQNGSSFQYVANVKTPQHALGGSYTVFLFDGQPASGTLPDEYIFAPNFIGPVAVLSLGTPNTAAKNIIVSSVPLTRTLQGAVSNGTLSDLTEANVAEYLKDNLVWKIVSNSSVVDPSSVPGFSIGVYASTATPLTNIYELPTWSPFFLLESITRGKPGGVASLNATASSVASAVSSIASQVTSVVGAVASAL